MNGLPPATRERWQPLRLGLVDLFYYDREEFPFRDGRLLLRGNNGTGKSKVLALTLPFLLDGDLSPYRVEPDADANKKMAWNLLLGGEHPNDERLGYTWMEFGRRDGSGQEFCTIGCGLKAVKGRGIASHWFFVTDQRVDAERFSLIDPTGTALTADRLEEAIATHGAVFHRARDYRRAVDERLFGLGEARYGTLIDLLIKMRAPQLSRRPDERGLSAALTESLPPLDQALITDVAEAFRALEEDAAQLAGMVEARDASQRYLTTYRAYARLATRRQSTPVRQAQTVFDRVSRELAEAEQAQARAATELTQAQTARVTLRTERARLDARREALKDDPAARSARELHRANADAEDAARRHDELRTVATRQAQRSEELRGRQSQAVADLEAARAALAAVREQAERHAAGVGVTPELGEALGEAEDEQARRRARAVTERRAAEIERVRTLAARVAQARTALAEARASTERIASEQAVLASRHADAQAAVRGTAATYLHAAHAQLTAAHELELEDPAAVLAALQAWLETLDGANPLDDAVTVAGREAARRLERTTVQAGDRAAQSRAAIEALQNEIEGLEAGVQAPPPAPYTRAQDTRDDHDGSPFWQLVDFREQIPDADRAGLEAALEAAGILDGWVTRSGELIDPDTADVQVAPAGATDMTGARLSAVLVPAVAERSVVSEESVQRLLEAIGLGEHVHGPWVDVRGRFRNGVLSGAWRKQGAVFVGQAAREAARLARLAERREQLRLLGSELAEIERELAALDRRRAQLERELAALPSDAGVRDADRALAMIVAELGAAVQRLTDARGREHAAAAAEEQVRDAFESDAADLGLPADDEELIAAGAALARLRETLAALWPARVRLRDAERTRTLAASDVQAAQAEQDATATRLHETDRSLAVASERRDTLRATAGAAIAELERQLHEVDAALGANATAQQATETRLSQADRADAAAQALAQELHGQLEATTSARLAAVDALRRFAGTGLIAVALPELELPDPGGDWNVTAALRLAREAEQQLAQDSDDEPRWVRLQRQVTDELGTLADALRRHGNNAAASFREGGIVVEITFQGHTAGLPKLVAALAQEVVERQRLLDSREREILENHLVAEIASTLQELISAAEQRVLATNRELAQRPTSTGMQLRLRWVPDPDGPDGLVDARARLLRQITDAWSEADRAAIGGFLQNQIQAVRARDAAGTWLEQLTDALDYRRWHRFVVERHQGGSWRPASGPSSGGERVLAASVPLFAAASSYYSSAGSQYAPRLVMLDEAFAGVDNRARAQCLGLLASFDLDVVMTSEREWGCYAEVPGLSIAQLSRVEGIPAVLVSLWEWDGRSCTRVEPAVRPGLPAMATGQLARPQPAGERGSAPDEPSLWDPTTGA